MYVLPPNNAVAAITDLNRNDDYRRTLVDLDIQLQTQDINTVSEQRGPIRGGGWRAR
jgi:hypothetical protein